MRFVLPFGLAACLALLSGAAPAADNNWSTPRAPFKIFGNTYYVGTQGIAAMLITSAQGHILIDGAPADAAPHIAASIRSLGFKIEDVKLILNSHAHFDHAGGIAALQRLSGASVKASPLSAPVLSTGKVDPSDPQAATLVDIEPGANVAVIKDGETLDVGTSKVRAVFTPGHTPGGTTWTWRSCEGPRCVDIVYADSLSAVSSSGFRFSDSPNALADFSKSFSALGALPCDIMITVHPEFSNLFGRLQKRETGDADGLIDTQACRRYVESMRQGLANRLAGEKAR